MLLCLGCFLIQSTDPKIVLNFSRTGVITPEIHPVRSYLTYRLKRLSIPVLAISLALGARLLLDPVLHNRMPYGLFIIAVILTARLADTWETLVALILWFLMAGWFFF